MSPGITIHAIFAAALIGVWGLPSSHPSPAQQIQYETPTQQDAAANPLVQEQQRKSNDGASEKENNNDLITRFLKLIREYNAEIVTISTAIMALFTVALFVSTHALWVSGKRHSERELRAYLNVAKGDAANFGTSEPVDAVLLVRNTGQTPAYEVTLIVTINVLSVPRTEFPHLPDTGQPRSESTIGSGVELEISPTARRALSADERARVVSGELGIFVFGEISYRDAFKKIRFTRFRYGFIGRGHDPGTNLVLTPEERGNEST